MSLKNIVLVMIFFVQGNCVVQSQQTDDRKSNFQSLSSKLSPAQLRKFYCHTTPLHICVVRNKHEQVEAMISIGCDTTALDRLGKPADFYAQDQRMKNIFLREAVAFYQDAMKGNNIIGPSSLHDKRV